MTIEEDSAAKYKDLAGRLARAKLDYALNTDPEADAKIEKELALLRDAMIAILENAESIERIASEMNKPAQAFIDARENLRGKNVKDWKQMGA